MSLGKVKTFASCDVKVTGNFVHRQRSVNSTSIVRLDRSETSLRHFGVKMFVSFVHDFSDRVILFGEIAVEVIHVVKVLPLLGTKIPPDIFLLYDTECKSVLIRAVEDVGSNILARHFHSHIEIELKLALNIHIRHKFEN